MIKKITFAAQNYCSGKCIYLLFVIMPVLFITPAKMDAQNELSFYLNAAFQNNPALKENTGLIRISEIDKSLAESEHSLPQISLTSNYIFVPYFNNNGKLISSDPDPKAIGYDAAITDGGLYSAQINVEKNIFNGGTLNAYEAQSDIRIKNAQYSSELIKHSLTKDVTEQYIKAYQAQQLYLLAKAIAEKIDQQRKITEDLVNKGFSRQSDLLLLKIEFENQLISAEQFEGDFRSNLSDLKTTCGLSDSLPVVLNKADLKADNIKRGTDFLKQYHADSLLISNQQEIFETKYNPQVNLFFNAGVNAVQLEGIQKKFGISAGINFSLPIYDGNQKGLTRQQTEISLKTVDAYRENQLLTISNKKRESRSQIDLYTRNLESINRQIDQYEQMLKLSEAELTRGQLSVIEYITLIKNYLELKKNEVAAQCGYLLAINQFNYWNW